MAQNKKMSGITWIMTGVIVVVLALGVYAVSGPIGDIIQKTKSEKAAERLMAGEGTVADMADLSGLSVDEYLAQYNVTAEDNITGSSKMVDFENVLSIAEYCDYAGVTYTEEDFNAYKTEKELGEDVTLDSTDSEVKTGFLTYVYEKQQAEQEASESADATATTDEKARSIADVVPAE